MSKNRDEKGGNIGEKFILIPGLTVYIAFAKKKIFPREILFANIYSPLFFFSFPFWQLLTIGKVTLLNRNNNRFRSRQEFIEGFSLSTSVVRSKFNPLSVSRMINANISYFTLVSIFQLPGYLLREDSNCTIILLKK